MADPQTQEEFQEWLNKQAELLDKGIISQQEYDNAVKDASVQMKGYAAQLKASQEQMKKDFVALGGSIMKGEEGASVYNKAINSTADTISSFLSKIPYVGKILGLVVTAAAKYATAVNEQADALMKNYKELSRNGLATGMKDTFENLQDMGYTAAEVGRMGALMKENSNVLANYGGTAAQGAKLFAKASKDIQYSDVGNQLKLMGMSVDDINKGMAGYAKIQQLSGTLQKQSSEQLAQSAADYMMKQDKLTKLTGQSAEQQNSIVQQAMADQRYAATQADLRRKGDATSIALSERNDELLKRFTAEAGPKSAKMFQDYASGMMNSEDSQKFRRLYGNAAAMIDGGITNTDQIMKAARNDAQAVAKNSTTLAKQGMFDDMYGSFAETAKIAGNALNKNMDTADAVADKQQADQKAGSDKGVKNMVDITNAQRNQTMAADKLINVGIVPVTKGMAALSEGIENATDIVGQLSGRKERVGGGETVVSSAVSSVNDQVKKIIGVESGGKNVAAGPNSSASGVAGMTKGAFEDLAKKAKPGSALYGKSFKDMQGDVNLQMSAAQQLTDDNIALLQKNGIVANDANVYLAHFLGPYGAVKLLKAADGTSLDAVVSADAMRANASVFKNAKTVGDLKAWADKRMVSQDTNKIDANVAAAGGKQPSAASGGILTGPKSGFQATLHGTEAVVPLPDGRTIPVQMKSSGGSAEQTQLLTAELDKLESLVRIMQKQNDLSTKILQRHS